MLKLLLFTLIYSSILSGQDQFATTNNDTIPNYYLFEYIDSLTPADYELMLDSIKNGLSDDFFTLRMAYTKTEDYSPYDVKTGDMHKRIRNFIDDENYPKALLLLDTLLTKNYVDINSHLYCGYIFYKQGDTVKSDYHYNIYNGLLESIYISGDGENPRTAYIVINTKEEYAFLDWFELIPDHQEFVTKDNFAFDLINTARQDTNQEYDVYFNITIALNYLSESYGNDR